MGVLLMPQGPLINKPPRPATGTGDVIIPFGDTNQEVILRWKDGDLLDVLPHPNNTTKLTVTFVKTTEGADPITPQAVTCSMCAHDTDSGQKVCWPVKCPQ
jgi:hypothetical protein